MVDQLISLAKQHQNEALLDELQQYQEWAKNTRDLNKRSSFIVSMSKSQLSTRPLHPEVLRASVKYLAKEGNIQEAEQNINEFSSSWNTETLIQVYLDLSNHVEQSTVKQWISEELE